jgi:hypothetical protein
MSRSRRLAVGVSLVLAQPSYAQKAYTVVDLGGLPGSVSDHASGVNDRGEIVGFGADTSGYGDRAIMWIPKKAR